ncbi:GTP 3',8-cyclase MoaA [Deltaproteobacteria bacterium TL4]
MLDSYGRTINKLRLSVGSVCNLGCIYCVDRAQDHCPSSSPLSSEQLLKLVGLLKDSVGIEKIRLTGGEPLLFKPLPHLIEGLSTLGLSSIGLTTNGVLLANQAARLKAAGLQKINISLDSVDSSHFKTITRGGRLSKTLQGIESAVRENLQIKINTVVIRGINESEILDILDFGLSRGIEVRFLELMKMGPLYCQSPSSFSSHFVSMREILESIRQKYSFKRLQEEENDATAIRFRLPGGTFGIIANESAPFCRTCSRLRLSVNGELFGCLSHPQPISIRHVLEHPHPEQELHQLVEQAVRQKRTDFFSGSPLKMSYVGG